MVKKVVRRAEVKGHRDGFRVSGVFLIEAADNPRPVHKLCHQTQHPKQDHHLESPRTRIVHALEVSETSCAEKLRDRKPSLFNTFEIFDHTGYTPAVDRRLSRRTGIQAS